MLRPLARVGLLAPFVALFVGAGCAVTPPPEHDEVVAQALETVDVRATWAAGVEGGAAVDGWVASFGDAGLEAAVSEALLNNLDLAVAAANLERVAAQARAAGASLAPVLNATGATLDREAGDGTDLSSSGLGLDLSWELDLWGRLRTQASAADESYAGAALDVEYARQSLAAATAKAWFLATETQQQARLAEEQVETLSEMLRVTTARRDAGKVGDQDVRLVSANVQSAKERFEAARAAHDGARRSLEVIMGRYPAAEIESAQELPSMPPAIATGVPSELLERRPDLAAAERRVRAAFQVTRSTELTRLPRISLNAGAGASSELRSLTSGAGFFGVGANFFAPILDGGAIASQVEIATADQEAALAGYGAAALRGFSEVENQLDADTSLRKRESFAVASLTDLEEAYRIRSVEVEAGKADMLSVLQLQSQVNAQRSQLISLRRAARAARVSLHLALGGDFR